MTRPRAEGGTNVAAGSLAVVTSLCEHLIVRVLLSVALVSLLAAGCADDDPGGLGVPSDTTTTSPATRPTSTTTPSGPAHGGADTDPGSGPGPSIAEEGLFVANHLPAGMELTRHLQGNRGSYANYSLPDVEPDPATAPCGQPFIEILAADRPVELTLPPVGAYDEIEVGDRVIYRTESPNPRTRLAWRLEDGRSLRVMGMA